MAKFGYRQQDWDGAFQEARGILAERASRRANPTISYSELADLIRTIRFAAEETAFHALLGEISVAEDLEGRGMLSVLVVHKGGDLRPGRGFFELASELGKDVRDEDRLWVEELEAVRKAHAAKSSRG
jgi:hypothetical protein